MCALLSFLSTTASAQTRCEPAPTRNEEALALFQAGSAAAQAERWAEAYAITCAPSALFNAGVALLEAGQYREARNAFDAIAGLYDAGPDLRASARQRRALAEARMGRLSIDADEGLVELDGGRVLQGGHTELAVDPGRHTLRLTSEAGNANWSGVVESGMTVSVRLRVTGVSATERRMGGPDLVGPTLVLGSASALALAAAIVAGVSVDRNAALRARCESGVCFEEDRGLADEVQQLSLAADLIGAGAAAAGALGVVWLILAFTDGEERAVAACGGGGCGARIRW